MVSDGLEIHDVPGKSEGMFGEPNVRVLAQKLQACLDRAAGDWRCCPFSGC